MDTTQNSRSFLVKMRVCNFGCIGPDGLDVALDNIVCLVGENNTGKSTVLRAYEAAYLKSELSVDDVFTMDIEKHPDFVRQSPTVELWVHIPDGAENIDAKWKEPDGELLLVRSKWTWPAEGGKPSRETWDPSESGYAVDGKAAGLDNVFGSRLPRPFRIGSLDDPAAEHKKLLELILEPIKARFVVLMKQDDSPLRERIKELQAEAEKPVGEFKEDLDKVQGRVNTSYRRVFSSAEIRLSVSLGELSIDPGAALVRSSHVGVVESQGLTRWSQQGTGSQRALFWSMLEVRSELNRIADERKKLEKMAFAKDRELKKKEGELAKVKLEATKEKKRQEIETIKDDIVALRSSGSAGVGSPDTPFLPGYMLLIDEPETALHPSAVRAAKEHLYSLAAEAGWQVMLSTHHPAFVDPLKDHTTIVRLHRPEANTVPNVYRADTVGFNGDQKEILKTLLAFDQSVAEMFFSRRVIIVEGDTELAAFTVVMDADKQAFPPDERPLILRARGKWTIPILLRMLSHFRVCGAVLHDVDSPRSSTGAKANGAYTANQRITDAVKAARDAGVHMIHRHSMPNFEVQHGMELPTKDKPFAAWKATGENDTIRQSVREVLDELCTEPQAETCNHAEDGCHYEVKLKQWVADNAATDAAYSFD